jgi:hypothetical protein
MLDGNPSNENAIVKAAHERASGIQPWERRPSDTDRSWEAFEEYRTMGTSRSLLKTANKLGKSVQLLDRWSKHHGWFERVQAFDRYEARSINERVLLGTAEMRSRMVNQALGMQARAQSRILKMTDEDIASLKPGEVIALMRVSADMERKARDIPEAQFMMFDKMPTFEVQVIRPGIGMVGVQLEDGRYGYIPEKAMDEFREDHPNAVIVG